MTNENSIKQLQSKLHLENPPARPKFNRHLCAGHKDPWFHSHFHCPLAKLQRCTLKRFTGLSIQMIPGRAHLCHFLARRNEWQMDFRVEWYCVLSSAGAVELFEHMQSRLNWFWGRCVHANVLGQVHARVMNKILAHHRSSSNALPADQKK